MQSWNTVITLERPSSQLFCSFLSPLAVDCSYESSESELQDLSSAILDTRNNMRETSPVLKLPITRRRCAAFLSRCPEA